ncbi:MAG: thiamine-phosphate kinase [Pseudomonadota bacterium]|nr:thiamine-phosphate kinase [Pseudomonadota bacterium]
MKNSLTIADWGEFGFIEALKRRLPKASAGLKLGIGDDASWWSPVVGNGILTTTDMLVEGVHFDLSYTLAADLGYKSLAVNLSDLAAMGAQPSTVYLSLALPAGIEKAWLENYVEAFLELAQEYGVQLAGGDTVKADQLVISVTLCGLSGAAKPVLRSRAAVGDDLYFSGSLGDSYLGLQLLLGRMSVPDDFEDFNERAVFLQTRHLRPSPRVEVGALLAASGAVTAMLDVSDGVIADLGHLLTASGGLGAELEASRLPLSVAGRHFIEADLVDYGTLLSGGEDYELLFSAPPEWRLKIETIAAETSVELARIGRITAPAGIYMLADGSRKVLSERGGYDHFQDQSS